VTGRDEWLDWHHDEGALERSDGCTASALELVLEHQCHNNRIN